MQEPIEQMIRLQVRFQAFVLKSMEPVHPYELSATGIEKWKCARCDAQGENKVVEHTIDCAWANLMKDFEDFLYEHG